MIPGSEEMPFRLYTVAETKKPIRTSGGMQIVPDYTIENAPPPKVIVIPAQSHRARRYWNGSGNLRKPPMSPCRFAQAHLFWRKPDC